MPRAGTGVASSSGQTRREAGTQSQGSPADSPAADSPGTAATKPQGACVGVPVGARANLSLALALGRFDVVHGFEPGLPSLSYLALRDAQALTVATFLSPERLELSALVDLHKIGVKGKLAMGLSVVVEQEDGGLAYWALKHAPGRPDFHHRDAFALELA